MERRLSLFWLCLLVSGWAPGTNPWHGPSQRAGAALQPNTPSIPNKSCDWKGAHAVKEVEGTCSLRAAALHISSREMRASAATAPCHSQRALERSFTCSNASLLESWFPLHPKKLGFEVGLGYRIKQTPGSCQLSRC